MKRFLIPIMAVVVLASCEAKTATTPDKPDTQPEQTKVKAPSEVKAAQNRGSVIVEWTDNSDDESGFTVYALKEDAALPFRVGSVKADSTSIAVSKDLKVGGTYSFGVCATSRIKDALNSEIVYSDKLSFQEFDPSTVEWVGEPSSTYASIVLGYRTQDFSESITEMGLCWGEKENPDVEGAHLASSMYVETGTQKQSVPSVVLEVGKTYHFRAYAVTASKVRYSEDVTASLAPQPEDITFGWTEITPSGYPNEVKAYKTSSTLDGSPINAWYVIADISTGKVGLRAEAPGGVQTLETQWSSDCLAMINAGYFYNSAPVGLCVINGSVKSTIASVRGTLRSDDSYSVAAEYNTMYNVTRGAFGITADGQARAVFNNNTSYFDAPLPNYIGEQKYGDPAKAWADHKISWSPKYAIGAGPMLVYGGKVLPELTESERGAEFFINNNELIPYDIYNKGVSPDRTAIGKTADGKIIFFVCDGRIKSSDGATIDELARIMKGLGCVEAVNMDGGGSTAMLLTTGRVNSLESNMNGGTENRKVPTVWCFYKK